MSAAKHPDQAQLALFAGNDLSFWNTRRVRRHILACTQCGGEVQALQTAIRKFHASAAELPDDLNWSRLTEEMTGNIRVGFAAGECIADFEKTVRPSRSRLVLQSVFLAAAVALIVTTLWVNFPKYEMSHLAAALSRTRWERIGTTFRNSGTPLDVVMLEASPASIQVRSNGSSLSLMHPRSDGATVSVNMQDSAGVRYVDSDTGQVTINKVYYAQ